MMHAQYMLWVPYLTVAMVNTLHCGVALLPYQLASSATYDTILLVFRYFDSLSWVLELAC